MTPREPLTSFLPFMSTGPWLSTTTAGSEALSLRSSITCQKINRSHAHAHDSRTNHSPHEHRASPVKGIRPRQGVTVSKWRNACGASCHSCLLGRGYPRRRRGRRHSRCGAASPTIGIRSRQGVTVSKQRDTWSFLPFIYLLGRGYQPRRRGERHSRCGVASPVKRSTGHTHTHTTAEQTTHHTNTEHHLSKGYGHGRELR